MDEMKIGQKDFLPRVRRLGSLGSLRREIVRCYDEARKDKPEKIGFYRGLGYLLTAAVDAMKAESLEDIEARILQLERDQREAKK
jgi:hypothetical protein